MKINAQQFMAIKNTPNSCYDLIKPEFLFHSNKLEGSTFTESELQRLVNERVVSGEHDVDDVIETMNSIALFDYVVDTLVYPLSDRTLLEMNRILSAGTREEACGFSGHYKHIANRIRGSRIQTALPSDVPEAMGSIIESLNDTQADFAKVAKTHARFEHVHPFQNGNGRIGRVLMLRQCVIAGIDLIVIDSEFEKDYKTWLEIAQADGDFRFYFDALKKCEERFDEKMGTLGVDKMLPSEEASSRVTRAVAAAPRAEVKRPAGR